MNHDCSVNFSNDFEFCEVGFLSKMRHGFGADTAGKSADFKVQIWNQR